MFKRIIFFAIIAGLVYLNYTNPKEADHKAVLISQLQEQGIPEDLYPRIWNNVDYSNFMVCSFMKTTEDSKMITSGYLEKVELVNDKWAENVSKELSAYIDRY